MTDRIPGLTIAERAEELGLTYLEERELEEREPWVAHWSARYARGAERLRAWLAAGRPFADRAALCIAGDREIVAAVRAVLAKLPEAVAHHVVASAFVVCTGHSTRGWVGEMPVAPCDAPQLVALSDTDPGVISHELAHVFQRRGLPAAARLTTQQHARLRSSLAASAIEEGSIAVMLDDALQRERAADALATAWGFHIDTTSGCRGARRREHMARDIELHASAPDIGGTP